MCQTHNVSPTEKQTHNVSPCVTVSFLIHLIYLFKVIYDHVSDLKYSSSPPFGFNKQREKMYKIRKVDECGNVVGEVIFLYQTIRLIKIRTSSQNF